MEADLSNQKLTPPLPADIPVPSSKASLLPWIVLGISLCLFFVSGGLLLWKIKNTVPEPDLIINAPTKVNPSLSSQNLPSPESSPTQIQEFIFEKDPYQNSDLNFQIKIPQGWSVDDSGTTGSVVILVDPQTTTATGGAILTYINVSVSNASGETFTNYIKQAKDGLVSAHKSYIFEEDKEITRQGITYYLLGGNYPAYGVTMKNRNLLLTYKDRTYIISATAPESAWKIKELLFNATLFSFQNN
jgi:hypothetical protein